MNRIAMCLLIATGYGVALASEDIPPPRPVDVAALVRQLGSDEYVEREAASRRLSTLSVDAVPPELFAALQSPNPEVRERTAKAVKALREHIAQMHLPRDGRFAKRGQIDLYVASTAASKWKVDDNRLWIPAFEAGVRAVEHAGMTGDRKPQGGATWFKDFPTYRASYPSMRFIQTDTVYARPEKTTWIYQAAIHSAGVADPASMHALAVSRGPVSAKGMISKSLVLANGDVTSGDDLNGSVVICDGDVRVAKNVLKSLIIARGKITVDGLSEMSSLIAGGTITIAKPSPLAPAITADIVKVAVEEKTTKPLGYITFFELSAVGAEVKLAGKALRVASVAADKPFAGAGVRAGDVITAVNGKAPDLPEALRRLLRDALAVGDATVTLRRGDKVETVKVTLPD